MPDIIINGATFADVPSIEIPKPGGGVAEFFDMDSNLAYLGPKAEWLGQIFGKEYKLEDTLYNGWTASTTAKAIVASETLTEKVAADLVNYEYILRWRFRFDRTGLEGATLKAVPDIECNDLYQHIIKRPGSLATIQNGSFTYNACITHLTTPLLIYYNTSGSRSYTFSTSYGFYIAAVAATFSNSTSNAPNITVKTPTINARCNSTYFATGRAAEIDQSVISLKLRGDLYRVRKGSFLLGAYHGVVDVLNNDFNILGGNS